MSGGVYKKINQVLRSTSIVVKNANIEVGGRSYNAVRHDDVTELLHGPVAEAGLMVIPNEELCDARTEKYTDKYGKEQERWVARVTASLEVVDVDDPTSRIKTKCSAYAFDNGDKATGKAYSMAIKYCYLKLFMLASHDEEEDRVAEGPQRQVPQKKPNVPTTPKKSDVAPIKGSDVLDLIMKKTDGGKNTKAVKEILARLDVSGSKSILQQKDQNTLLRYKGIVVSYKPN